MTTATKAAQAINSTFTARIVGDDAKGAWTYVLMPGSAEFFGTGRPVKVAGTVDGHRFQATMLPMGGGTHMLPLKAALREAVGKPRGDEVTVRLEQRFS